ncbi:hypothetical protein LMG9964_03255 [Paraburkholderia phenoliruptrix]|uniref:Uncharacterized protein n=1 Tax=Paraburkholderia phenoliruptrix TaxID=252970 RepID=A0A6J5K9F7_9BURK|nr:hypothetical protein LMG9964_03255 [Paraburkholderia phenoliruptrix]
MLWSFERPLHSESRPMLNAQFSAKETLGDRSGAPAAGWFAPIRDSASANGTSRVNGRISPESITIVPTGKQMNDRTRRHTANAIARIPPDCDNRTARADYIPVAPAALPSRPRENAAGAASSRAVSSGKSNHDAFAGATNSLVYVRCRSICLPLIAGLIVDRTLRTFSGPPAGILPSGVYIAMVDFNACT